MELSDHIFDPVHFHIHMRDRLCALKQGVADRLIAFHLLDPLFVTELMLQCGPEIHSDGTDLDLRPHQGFSLGKEYRHVDDHMITAVAVRLWILYIIPYFHYSDVILAAKKIRYGINIINKGAYHTYPGHIVKLGADVFRRKVIPQFLELAVDTFRLLDPALDKRNGISLVFYGKFIVQDFALGTDLPDGAAGTASSGH